VPVASRAFGALTTRNLDDIRSLLDAGRRLLPTTDHHDRVVARALAKAAPFHRQRNSVADALLIELYTTVVAGAALGDAYEFVTSKSEDFSDAHRDKRIPHSDLADVFAAEHSTYRLGVDGLEQCMHDEFGDHLEELIAEMYFPEEVRGLVEILAAEKEIFDKVWVRLVVTFFSALVRSRSYSSKTTCGTSNSTWPSSTRVRSGRINRCGRLGAWPGPARSRCRSSDGAQVPFCPRHRFAGLLDCRSRNSTLIAPPSFPK